MMRRIAPNHKEWTPHEYQARAVDHLCMRGSAALFLDPGMGKTAITLSAICALMDAGIIRRTLVIAPMRVCQLVWEQEAAKWTQFRHLKFANMAGKPAERRLGMLKSDADIWLINPEGVDWLCKQFFGTLLPFDTLVIDELTKFKNPRAVRSKNLHPFADKIARRWGLTGTPIPNGYMDLFGQMRMIDGGASLGKYITHFRDRFFNTGRDGFSYELRPGADKQIEQAIAPYVFRASASDYLELPPLVDNPIILRLDNKTMHQYKALKRDMVLELEGKTVTAANAAAVYNKLQQFTGGAVYTIAPEYTHVHDVKIDALKDLVEELSGQPLFVAYAYGHELERLQKVFPDAPFIGGGVSAKTAAQIEQDWNAGKIPVLFGHPASVGHGLNFQLGGAANICWFTQTWDYELYEQFIRRIHRQGTSAARVINHKLVVENTIDELVAEAVEKKETTQLSLLSALKTEFEGTGVVVVDKGASDMRKLVSPTGAPVEQAPAQAGWGTPQSAPAGWGPSQSAQTTQPVAAPVQAPAGWGPPPQSTPGGSWAASQQPTPTQAPVQPTGWTTSQPVQAAQSPAQTVPPAPTGWGQTVPAQPQVQETGPNIAIPGTTPEGLALFGQPGIVSTDTPQPPWNEAQQAVKPAMETKEAKKTRTKPAGGQNTVGEISDLARFEVSAIRPARGHTAITVDYAALVVLYGGDYAKAADAVSALLDRLN